MKKIKIPLIVKVLIAIIIGSLIGQYLPEAVVRGTNTFSFIFDQLLGFFIPLIILGFVTPAIAGLGGEASKMLLATTILAYTFTILSGLFGYAVGTEIFPSLLSDFNINVATTDEAKFESYVKIEVQPLCDVMTALVTSFIMGLGIVATKSSTLKKCFDELGKITEKAINKMVIPFLPAFICCLMINMSAQGVLANSVAAFLKIIVTIFAMSIALLIIQYIVAGLIAKKRPLKSLWNMTQAYLTALGTSSSAATIPVTLEATKKNGVRDEIAGFVIPLCATIHLSGSALKITACAIAIMIIHNMPFSFPLMFGFIAMLGIVMIAAPGIPGGAIMAALGILESILGFNDELQAMMITFYITMDSFGTACNVTGDGAIALIINKLSRQKL